MKKIFFSLAALLVVAMTAFTLTSCSNDDQEDGGLLLYQYGFNTSGTLDETTFAQLENAYVYEFKQIANATLNGQYVQFPYGSSSSTYTPQIEKACQAAEEYIEKNVTIASGFNANFHVTCVNANNKVVYSKDWKN